MHFDNIAIIMSQISPQKKVQIHTCFFKSTLRVTIVSKTSQIKVFGPLTSIQQVTIFPKHNYKSNESNLLLLTKGI